MILEPKDGRHGIALVCPERLSHVYPKSQIDDQLLFSKLNSWDETLRRVQQLFSFSLKVCLALVALGEVALIFLSDFSGYMFDIVILTLAFAMTLYCFVRAIRNYASDVEKLGL